MVRVETEDESVINGTPAIISVYEDEKLIMRMVAKVVPRHGADGGLYPSVIFLEKPEKDI